MYKYFLVLLKIAVNAMIGGIIYIVLSYKLHIIDDLFGSKIVNKIKKNLP